MEKTITVDNYREDKYYPRVVRVVAKILSRSNVVAPVDVLLEMGNLTKQNVEAWRRGSRSKSTFVPMNRLLPCIPVRFRAVRLEKEPIVHERIKTHSIFPWKPDTSFTCGWAPRNICFATTIAFLLSTTMIFVDNCKKFL